MEYVVSALLLGWVIFDVFDERRKEKRMKEWADEVIAEMRRLK